MEEEIKQQIATLLNSENHLQRKITTVNLDRYITLGVYGRNQTKIWAALEVRPRLFCISEIRHVVVHPEFRRRGFARHLMFEAFTRIRQEKRPWALLTVRADNESMIALCDTIGMERHGKARNSRTGHDILLYMMKVL